MVIIYTYIHTSIYIPTQSGSSLPIGIRRAARFFVVAVTVLGVTVLRVTVVGVTVLGVTCAWATVDTRQSLTMHTSDYQQQAGMREQGLHSADHGHNSNGQDTSTHQLAQPMDEDGTGLTQDTALIHLAPLPPPGLTPPARTPGTTTPHITTAPHLSMSTTVSPFDIRQELQEILEQEILEFSDIIQARIATTKHYTPPNLDKLHKSDDDARTHELQNFLQALGYVPDSENPFTVMGFAELDGPELTSTTLSRRLHFAENHIKHYTSTAAQEGCNRLLSKIQLAHERCLTLLPDVRSKRKLLKGITKQTDHGESYTHRVSPTSLASYPRTCRGAPSSPLS